MTKEFKKTLPANPQASKIKNIYRTVRRFFTTSEQSMWRAIQDNDLGQVKNLLALNVNPNTPYVGSPPLVSSYHAHKYEIFLLLLAHGADPNVKYQLESMATPMTLMQRIINLQDTPTMKLIVLYGGNPDINIEKDEKNSIKNLLDVAAGLRKELVDLTTALLSNQSNPIKYASICEKLAVFWKKRSQEEEDNPLYKKHYVANEECYRQKAPSLLGTTTVLAASENERDNAPLLKKIN